MKRENLTYLLVGLAFGLLVGFGAYRVWIGAPAPAPVAAQAGSAPAASPENASAAQGSSNLDRVMARLEPLRARIESNPEDTAALVELGDVLFGVGMWEQAVQFYERAQQQRPDSPQLLTVIGLCYRQLGDPEKALEHFERVQADHPEHFESLYNIAVVNGIDLGRLDRAAEALERLEQLRPGAAEVQQLRAEIDKARGRGSS